VAKQILMFSVPGENQSPVNCWTEWGQLLIGRFTKMSETPEIDSSVPEVDERGDEKDIRVADLKHIRSSDFKVIYTDAAGLALNFYSLSVIFGQIIPDSAEGMVIEDRVFVTMSLEHAKALAHVLLEHIAKYEAKSGQIRQKPK